MKDSIMVKLASFIINFYKPFLVASILATILIGVMIKKIEINDKFVQYFTTLFLLDQIQNSR